MALRAVTTPLLLLDLLLTCGLPWPTILITLLVDEVMIVTGLVGALTRTSYKWVSLICSLFAND
jgi:bacteriorhodopsin